MDLGFLDTEHLCERPGSAVNPLCRVMNDQAVAIPGDGGRIGLDRIVIVPGRAIDRIDTARRGLERGIAVAALEPVGLDHQRVRRLRMRLRLIEARTGNGTLILH